MGRYGTKAALGLAGAVLLTYASTASATLTTFQSYSGTIGLSVNGGGSSQSTLPLGLTAEVPTGSSVVAAYLYTSSQGLTSAAGGPMPSGEGGGTFGGSAVTYTSLIVNASSTTLQAGRADVTSTVQALVNPLNAAAVGGVYNFAVTESSSQQDGEVLIVIYTNASLPTASIGILEGAAVTTGDTSSINFASNPAGQTVYMSIGDGFSYDLGGGGQVSTITVDGSLLTSAAGNCDDSQDGGTIPNPTTCTNGDLITAGILGLNADGSVNTTYSNPFTPIGDTNVNTDHELYNISSLINPAAGNTISLTTLNTSNDDNIFEEVFYVQGLAGFNAPPPPGPTGASPEPGSFVLLGTGALGLINQYRKRKS